MKALIMRAGATSRGQHPLLLLLQLTLVCIAIAKAQEEDFSCRKNSLSKADKSESGGSQIGSDKRSQTSIRQCRKYAVIIPTGDIVVEVGKQTKQVLCRFNSSLISTDDVYFSTRDSKKKQDLPPLQVVNSSTIMVEIFHTTPEKYILFCRLRRRNGKNDKNLCSQIVKAGYPPKDVDNFSCVSINYETVNCTWDKPENPVSTCYEIPSFSVPKYLGPENCSQTNHPYYTSCFFNRSFTRDHFQIHFNASNQLGFNSFVHTVNILEIVIPKKISASVSLIGALKVNVTWNLTYPIDILPSGLIHSVDSRLKGHTQWQNVTTFFHKYTHEKIDQTRAFSIEDTLPFANTDYEYRVRIHTAAGELKENMWSPYDVLSITTKPTAPPVAPATSESSFEVEEFLDVRDVYVNYKAVPKLLRAGDNFRYQVQVFAGQDQSSPLDLPPPEVTDAYFKYKNLNFTEYRFAITPVNDFAPGNVSSEVVVPNSDCMPKKTGMFTVILSSTDKGKIFSLYWVPSHTSNEQCQAGHDIDSYTIFWCKQKKAFGYRCKDELDWMRLSLASLVRKDLSHVTRDNIVIYEHNVTSLPETEIFSFGIAANAGRFSSGIRWSTCIVDDMEAPLSPEISVQALTNDSRSALVKWRLKCHSLSAVPLGFHIYYCKARVQDFGHCTSEVLKTKVDSPSSQQHLISELDGGFSYIFSVAVLTIIGESVQSPPKKLQLAMAAPDGPPLDLEIERTSSTTVSLAWKPPSKLRWGGPISHYIISSVPIVGDGKLIVNATNNEEQRVMFELTDLLPFTLYKLKVSPCNNVGCGYDTPAKAEVQTAIGAPDPVENLLLDVNNWRLMWRLKKCNGRTCSVQVQIPVNETGHKTVSVQDEEVLSLRSEGVPCNATSMSFRVRAAGEDEGGAALYSNWTSVAKDPLDCPPAMLAWWVIGIVVFVCGVLTVTVLFIVKCGWRTIMKAIKDCKQKINLPKGIQVAETKEPLKDFSGFPTRGSFSSRDSAPPLLRVADSTTPNLGENLPSTKTRADSVSSEEVHLIETSDNERHGRNFSGSSGHSSSQDSAMMSGCPSLNTTDPIDLALELTPSESRETTLRQRSPGPPYVQHGFLPEMLSEGYVTACSVPSLPHLYKGGVDPPPVRQSLTDLKVSQLAAGWQHARRASTGYITFSDPGGDSPPLPDHPHPGPPAPPDGYTGLPPYSRHSFSPPHVKLEAVKGGYVTLADRRSPSPPSTTCNVGYVSAGDPFGALKRPPSLPLIPKSPLGGGEGDMPLGAYCRVGSRAHPANRGYVSAARVGDLVPQPGGPVPPKPPAYVSCGESTNAPFPRGPSKDAPYVELTDGARWAHPRPQALGGSAPMEGGTRVGHLPRPNTSEATVGHPQRRGGGGDPSNPSLSKQSSGYVSQETIAPGDAVVMSPKRLLSQASLPHTLVLSPGHQASMV